MRISVTVLILAFILGCGDYLPECAKQNNCTQSIDPLSVEDTNKESHEVLRGDEYREQAPNALGIYQVISPYRYPAGTIIIDTPNKKLYLMEEQGLARRYPIAIGKEGYSFAGQAQVGRKVKWPVWRPTPDMFELNPNLEESVEGGPENPLGARAIYLYVDGRDTLYRIHGNNNPSSIGHSASSGCIRMYNEDVIDLYNRVSVDTPVVVLAKADLSAGEEVDIISDKELVKPIDDPMSDFWLDMFGNPIPKNTSKTIDTTSAPTE